MRQHLAPQHVYFWYDAESLLRDLNKYAHPTEISKMEKRLEKVRTEYMQVLCATTWVYVCVYRLVYLSMVQAFTRTNSRSCTCYGIQQKRVFCESYLVFGRARCVRPPTGSHGSFRTYNARVLHVFWLHSFVDVNWTRGMCGAFACRETPRFSNSFVFRLFVSHCSCTTSTWTRRKMPHRMPPLANLMFLKMSRIW